MYALMDFGWQTEDGISLIFGRVERRNEETGEIEVVADFTGDAALRFPDVWRDLSSAQQDEIMQQLASRLLLLRAEVPA